MTTDANLTPLLDVLTTLEAQRREASQEVERLRGEVASALDADHGGTLELILRMEQLTGDELTDLRTRIKSRIRNLIVEMIVLVEHVGPVRRADVTVRFRSGGNGESASRSGGAIPASSMSAYPARRTAPGLTSRPGGPLCRCRRPRGDRGRARPRALCNPTDPSGMMGGTLARGLRSDVEPPAISGGKHERYWFGTRQDYCRQGIIEAGRAGQEG